jgi:hypothetical protein
MKILGESEGPWPTHGTLEGASMASFEEEEIPAHLVFLESK